MALCAALVLAWCWDARWGEPPHALHPVAWLGRVLGAIGQHLLHWPPLPAFIGGALAWCALAAGCTAAAWAWQQALVQAPLWLAVPLLALPLKPMFAWRMLRDEVAAVEAALALQPQQGLVPARVRLARLVSRDVSAMDADALRETALETLSENLSDSVVAPLFWFALLGLPGAVLYRMANTADAMWGYRGRWEWAGKWAARADDVLSWLPARLTGLVLAPPRCWPLLPAQARLTPSPNGGWPMGALALRLGVRLRKPGVYALNMQAPSPAAAEFAAALRHTGAVAWLAALVTAAAWGLRT
jgi:adenosylcobinamide-phosphate synthase